MNTNRTPKILLGLGIIILLVFIGVVYIVSTRESNTNNPITTIIEAFPELPFLSNNQENKDPDTAVEQETKVNKNDFQEFNDYKLKVKGVTVVKPSDPLLPSRVFAVEAETGHIYEISTTDVATTRLTNTTLKNVTEVAFGHTSTDLYIYYKITDNNVSQYLYGTLPLVSTSTTTTEVRSLGLRPLPNVVSLSVSPEGNKLFFFENFGAKLTGYTSNLDTSNKKLVVTTPYSSWKIGWLSATDVVLTTSPTIRLDGFTYLLNTNSSIATKVIDSKRGLSIIPMYSRNIIIATENRDGAAQTSLVSTNPSSTTQNIMVSSKIIPQTCLVGSMLPETSCLVMANNPTIFRSYPDSYFQGKVRDNQAVVLLNTETGEYRTLIGTDQQSNITSLQAETDQLVFFTTDGSELKSIFFD